MFSFLLLVSTWERNVSVAIYPTLIQGNGRETEIWIESTAINTLYVFAAWPQDGGVYYDFWSSKNLVAEAATFSETEPFRLSPNQRSALRVYGTAAALEKTKITAIGLWDRCSEGIRLFNYPSADFTIVETTRSAIGAFCYLLTESCTRWSITSADSDFNYNIYYQLEGSTSNRSISEGTRVSSDGSPTLLIWTVTVVVSPRSFTWSHYSCSSSSEFNYVTFNESRYTYEFGWVSSSYDDGSVANPARVYGIAYTVVALFVLVLILILGIACSNKKHAFIGTNANAFKDISPDEIMPN